MNKLCGFCQGKLEKIILSEKKYTVENKDYIVPNVKVLKCSKCGEEFISKDMHDYVMDYIEN